MALLLCRNNPLYKSKLSLVVVSTNSSNDSNPCVLIIEVDSNPYLCRTLPNVWVMNCDLAAHLSCSAQLISTILQPCPAKIRRNVSHLVISFLTLTFSKTKGRPVQSPFPLTGPNIGCVHNMSNSSGKSWRNRFRGNSLTERTSTNSGLPCNAGKGMHLSTALVERIEVHSTTTSGCSLQISCKSL